jgi:hypothetical protein
MCSLEGLTSPYRQTESHDRPSVRSCRFEFDSGTFDYASGRLSSRDDAFASRCAAWYPCASRMAPAATGISVAPRLSSAAWLSITSRLPAASGLCVSATSAGAAGLSLSAAACVRGSQSANASCARAGATTDGTARLPPTCAPAASAKHSLSAHRSACGPGCGSTTTRDGLTCSAPGSSKPGSSKPGSSESGGSFPGGGGPTTSRNPARAGSDPRGVPGG